MNEDQVQNAIHIESNEYGFEWPPSFNPEKHRTFMKKHNRKQHKLLIKWAALNGEYGRSAQLKALIRKGIPRQCRCDVWMSVSTAKELMLSNKGLYNDLVMKCPTTGTYKNITNISDERERKGAEHNLCCIVVDIPRTFPTNRFLKEPAMSDSLQNILVAFSLYKPDIGYISGLSFIVGILLLATRKENGDVMAEECFWLLVSLMDHILPDYFSHPKTRLNFLNDCLVLNRLVRQRKPNIHAHFERFELSFTYKWFMCPMMDVLPIHTLLNVWDALFYEGYAVMFRAIVYWFVLHKQAIKRMSDTGDLALFVNDHNFWDECAWDNYKYMKNVFKKSGKISEESIDTMRDHEKGEKYLYNQTCATTAGEQATQRPCVLSSLTPPESGVIP